MLHVQGDICLDFIDVYCLTMTPSGSFLKIFGAQKSSFKKKIARPRIGIKLLRLAEAPDTSGALDSQKGSLIF